MKTTYFLRPLLIVFIFSLYSCDDSAELNESLELEKSALQKKSSANNTLKCAKIQDGTIVDYRGEVIPLGVDDLGYNYQAKRYNGEMFPILAPGWILDQKWNTAFRSTEDCDGDNRLDYANGEENYRGTGAWTTTTWSRTYINDDEKTCKVSQFSKYIAVPKNATSDGINFYDEDGSIIGQVVNAEGFEDFALIQRIWNEPCAGINGVDYKAPGPVGLGNR